MTNEELNEAIRYLEEERLIVEAILYGENQDKFDSTIMLIDDVKFRESRKPLTIYDMAIKALDLQLYESCIRELIREFDNKHPALFADYMREFNNHPISEIIEYMWDMHNLIEDIKYRLPNKGGEEE